MCRETASAKQIAIKTSQQLLSALRDERKERAKTIEFFAVASRLDWLLFSQGSVWEGYGCVHFCVSVHNLYIQKLYTKIYKYTKVYMYKLLLKANIPISSISILCIQILYDFLYISIHFSMSCIQVCFVCLYHKYSLLYSISERLNRSSTAFVPRLVGLCAPYCSSLVLLCALLYPYFIWPKIMGHSISSPLFHGRVDLSENVITHGLSTTNVWQQLLKSTRKGAMKAFFSAFFRFFHSTL